MKHKLTAKNVSKVLRKLALDLDVGDNTSRKIVAERLDVMLDDLCADDFFGTEAQNDPRGDQRD